VTGYQVAIVAHAAAQIRDIDNWWRRERSAVPDLFLDEVDRALRRLVETPGAGAPYAGRGRPGVIVGPAGVRRMRLARSRYHVYYTIDDAARTVTVLDVWHASRGAEPLA
jgi:plasmid stabilization system protein ParE